jgi:hypothetical protein
MQAIKRFVNSSSAQTNLPPTATATKMCIQCGHSHKDHGGSGKCDHFEWSAVKEPIPSIRREPKEVVHVWRKGGCMVEETFTEYTQHEDWDHPTGWKTAQVREDCWCTGCLCAKCQFRKIRTDGALGL